ncbi:MAG: type II secretion system major pseudopilin GspG [Proteobacteria bacterium]|nr:type II secretion system major pseudopilin GspG [Pseudomonadota bacterium]
MTREEIPNACESARGRRGFTLIEIMAVVLIMGLLIGLVGYNVFANVDKARVATTKAQMKTVETALENFRLDNSRYPTSDQGLEALIRKPSSGPEPRNYPPDGYLQKASALKDAWGETFQYRYPGTHNTRSYDLWSLGADAAPGGEGTDGDVGNWDDETIGDS